MNVIACINSALQCRIYKKQTMSNKNRHKKDMAEDVSAPPLCENLQ